MPRRKKKSNKANIVEEGVTEEIIESDDLNTYLNGIASDNCLLKCSPQVGRYLIAKKALHAGDIILKDEPLVVGPCQNTPTVCIGCCLLLKTDIKSAHRCGGCGWPVCGGGCPGIINECDITRGGHVKAECEILKSFPQPLDATSFNVIVPLRCLLLRRENPKAWSSIMRMESHDDVRRQMPEIWNKNERTVVEPIRKMVPEYPEDLIHSICGKLEVNCFSVGGDEIEARALYPTAYLLQHDCTPNTTHLDDVEFNLTLRASVNIKQSDPITLSYTSSLYGTMRRRKELKESKFFDCVCARCSSSTELGTYMSAVKCSHCKEGWLLPHLPLENSSEWICVGCQLSVHYSLPTNITERSSLDFDSLKNPTISDYESLLAKYSKILHPNHSTIVRIKYALSQMYGKTEGYLLGQMPRELLKKKYDMCKDLLKVFDVVEPGMTRLIGVTLYESHAPLLILTQISAASDSLSQKQLKKDLRHVKDLLERATAILSFESPTTSEGRLYEVAKEALAQTQHWPI